MRLNMIRRTWPFALALAAAACSTNSRNYVVSSNLCTSGHCNDADLIETSYGAMRYMLGNVRPPIVGEDAFDATRPIIWASTVDLNNYSKTSNFGRLMGETLAIAMQNHRKTKMIQMTLRQGTVPITADGEFLLTRDVKEIATQFNAGAVLVSSYSVALDVVYVQVSLINVDQNAVVGACQFALPLGPRTRCLIDGFEYAEQAPYINNWTRPVVQRCNSCS
jgi:hypothetical protein